MPLPGETASFPVVISAQAGNAITGLESTDAFAGLKATDDGAGHMTALWATGGGAIVYIGKTAALTI
jgi:hypothetical protein